MSLFAASSLDPLGRWVSGPGPHGSKHGTLPGSPSLLGTPSVQTTNARQLAPITFFLFVPLPLSPVAAGWMRSPILATEFLVPWV